MITEILTEKDVLRLGFVPKELTLAHEKTSRKELIKYLDKEYIVNILNGIPANKDKMILQMLWMTGIRVTELINIKKKDFDSLNKTLRITWLKSRKWNERIIPVHPTLSGMLEHFVVGFKADQLLFPVSRQRVYQITKKLLGVNPHCLRHSFAVNFLRQSKNPRAIVVLKDLLGHKRIDTTMTYLQITVGHMAQDLSEVSFT